ncbi:NAD(P)H-dependent FMN reductase [Rhodobium orientis]|uniref:NADPH-dependent FMN reductase n=1 Tax=Rhodobium orientis TaxID=34017 RepID=A0A327JJF4_9HYPH|nr:NAD(P)H-dependent oxidoreductase [Rhodobium orientis]MBB4304495.1 NAD(P)H-dependent FMN reductase [Rhodobium orientis]MBK5948086.1 NADPH-dependent FMN reductase [Rhodobium orientis]RAI25383.1 NADPH-dependent FMN reductase [Rhodobium orientis]
MAHPKILLLSGSTRSGSYNTRLVDLATKRLAERDAEPTRISLADYPLPIYDADQEASRGAPEEAVGLHRLFLAHQGIFLASPEYNAGVSPLLKNAIDWISKVSDDKHPPLAAYRNRVFAVSAASPGPYGGIRGLIALRQVLEIGLGALVIPEQVAVPRADDAFTAEGELADERAAGFFDAMTKRLVDEARRYVAP